MKENQSNDLFHQLKNVSDIDDLLWVQKILHLLTCILLIETNPGEFLLNKKLISLVQQEELYWAERTKITG